MSTPPLERSPSAAERAIAFESALLERWAEPRITNWQIAGLPVWPLVAHALNTAVLEATLLGRAPLPARRIGRAFLAAHALLGERAFSSLPTAERAGATALADSPLWRAGDTVFFGSRASRDKQRGFFRTTDAFRCHAPAGRAPLLLVDETEVEDGATGLADQPVLAIGGRLAAWRSGSRNQARALRTLPGFEAEMARLAELADVPKAPLIRWLGRLTGHMLAYHARFEALLSAARPRALVLTDHGDALTAALCAAGRSCGVPVACAQHGALRRTDCEHPDHPFHGKELATLPGRHWVWRTERLGHGSAAVGPASLHPPFLDIGVGDGRSSAMASGLIVLAAPQNDDQLTPMMAALSALEPGDTVLWRPHPRLGRPDLPGRAASDVAARLQLDDGPLLDSLLAADLVVVGYSATALEACALGVDTHCVSEYAHWLMAGQTPPGAMSFGSTVPPAVLAKARDHALNTNVMMKRTERLARFDAAFGQAPKKAFDSLGPMSDTR